MNDITPPPPTPLLEGPGVKQVWGQRWLPEHRLPGAGLLPPSGELPVLQSDSRGGTSQDLTGFFFSWCFLFRPHLLKGEESVCIYIYIMWFNGGCESPHINVYKAANRQMKLSEQSAWIQSIDDVKCDILANTMVIDGGSEPATPKRISIAFLRDSISVFAAGRQG